LGEHMHIELPVLPTTLVGSYPKPVWLKALSRGLKFHENRKRAKLLKEAHDDAVTIVVRELEELGIDIPTDGKVRRDPGIEYFAKKVDGFKFYGPVRVWNNHYTMKPAIIDRLRYEGPIVVDEYLYLRNVAKAKVVKVTITGPVTVADWSFNEYYRSKEELLFDLAKIINAELKKLEEAGALYVQIDEPSLLVRPEDVELGVEAINEAVRGLSIKVGLHVCYSNYTLLKPYFDELRVSQLTLEFASRGFKDLELLEGLNKELGLGVIDVHSSYIEDQSTIARAIRKAMKYVKPECIYVNPDCGMKFLSRDVAREKLKSMVDGVRMVREELGRKGLESIEFRVRDTCP